MKNMTGNGKRKLAWFVKARSDIARLSPYLRHSEKQSR
jgi:hypothetical protein